MQAKDIFEQDQQYFMHTFARFPIVLSHGSGMKVWDMEGKQYLDFLAGIAVNALGHNHPRLVETISQQAAKMIHISNLFYSESQANLAEKLVKLFGGSAKVFLGNSGAEANEGALKLARKYATEQKTGKFEIITTMHSFHGRTLAALTATGQPKYQEGYGPLPGGFKYAPYNDLTSIKNLVTDKTCAIMVEPIQGESGIHVGTQDYLEGLRQLCDANGILLIFDEIQTGIGRTGKMFAFEHYGVRPDIVTLAKALGGGVPIGAIIAQDHVAEAFKPGDHGSTFGGNPLACAAALTTLDVIAKDDLLTNAIVVGDYFQEKLRALQQNYAAIVEVRGKGLMIGAQLSFPGRPVVEAVLQHGAIINCAGGNVLRFVPPLIATKADVDALIVILDKVFAEIEG
jgi:acetylornithine/N-succinyldiaminopimelate aminotransferase